MVSYQFSIGIWLTKQIEPVPFRSLKDIKEIPGIIGGEIDHSEVIENEESHFLDLPYQGGITTI